MTEVFGNEETTVEQKIALIIAEHDADERGLVQKRDELFGIEKKLKGQIEALTAEKSGYDTKISELEATLAKASTDNTASKEYWQSQFDGQLKAKDAEYSKLSEKFNGLQSQFNAKLRKEAIEEAVKDFKFVEGLKNGFTATLLYNNKFEPKDIDGQIIFLNENNKTIAEVARDFSLTNEGKAYLLNPSSGGGARPNAGGSTTTNRVNTWTRKEYEEKTKSNPQEVAEFFRKGGKIIED